MKYRKCLTYEFFWDSLILWKKQNIRRVQCSCNWSGRWSFRRNETDFKTLVWMTCPRFAFGRICSVEIDPWEVPSQSCSEWLDTRRLMWQIIVTWCSAAPNGVYLLFRKATNWEVDLFISFFDQFYLCMMGGLHGKNMLVWDPSASKKMAFGKILTPKNVRNQSILVVNYCSTCKKSGDWRITFYCIVTFLAFFGTWFLDSLECGN